MARYTYETDEPDQYPDAVRIKGIADGDAYIAPVRSPRKRGKGIWDSHGRIIGWKLSHRP